MESVKSATFWLAANSAVNFGKSSRKPASRPLADWPKLFALKRGVLGLLSGGILSPELTSKY
jgi:hypothetical protein